MSALLTETQVAEFLQLAPGTLQVWRCTKRYPLPYVKLARAIRYRMEDLQAFVAARVMPGDGSTIPPKVQKARKVRHS